MSAVAVAKESNPYFGRQHFSSSLVESFGYKNAADYTWEEWKENIYMAPWENVNHQSGFSLMDKRSGVTFSKMGVAMPHEDIMALRNNPDECLRILTLYFEKPFHNIADIRR